MNFPLSPPVPLNGEHTGTGGAMIGGEGELGVAVPLIVPLLLIAVPARTSPVTRPFFSSVTEADRRAHVSVDTRGAQSR